jgi:hypothetical protein
MKTYPISVVSRTLDPTQKSLTTVMGMYEHHLSDADVNLIQDLQDYKREKLLADEVVSGAVTWSPFQFTPQTANTFTIPAFDLLFNGQVVTIGGNLSSDITVNNIVLPAPQGQSTLGALAYVVFLQLRYTTLQDTTSYYADSGNGLNYFFPNGCLTADMPDILSGNPTLTAELLMDVVDPFENDQTTSRALVVWQINVQPVTLNYDFSQGRNGMLATYDSTGIILDPTNSVFAEDVTGTPIISNQFSFLSMASITGDSGLYRAGDGSIANGIGGIDGYAYGFPLAVVFQKNTGSFQLNTNPFGCGVPGNLSSGLIATGLSGRIDMKYADSIWPDEVVDTRSTVSLKDYNYDDTLRKGFVDLITGQTRHVVGRGTTLIPPAQSIGSSITYDVSVAPIADLNTNNLGVFDGYMNGFCSDSRVYYSTQAVSVNSKNVSGVIGNPWQLGDAFSISISPSHGYIEYAQVMTLVNNLDGTKTPVFLMPGQITISGLEANNPQTVTVTLSTSLTGTSFDPGSNPLYLTLGVRYSVGVGFDLEQIPTQIYGGSITDMASGKTLPIYAIDEYELQSTTGNLTSINTEYSNKVFGTRFSLTLYPGSAAATPSGSSTISIPNPSVSTSFLPSQIQVWNAITGQFYTCTAVLTSNTILSFTISNTISNSTILGVTTAGSQTTFLIPNPITTNAAGGAINGLHIINVADQSGNVQAPLFTSVTVPSATPVNELSISLLGNMTVPLVFTILCASTCQVTYNSAVRGIVAIEETVLAGTFQDTTNTYLMDTRIQVVSNSFNSSTNTVVLAVTGCVLKGISGNDSLKYVWVNIGSGVLQAIPITSVEFTNTGLITLVIPGTVNLEVQQFFMVAAILPALTSDSQMILSTLISTYQGEGVAGRNYDVLYTEEQALITTNGTGLAPLVGIADVYPYNRELPIITSLPNGVAWADSDLQNQPVSSYFDSNFEAKLYNNVEHTFEVPLYTNDFIQPIAGDKRKQLQLGVPASRGFSQILPHVGFAVHRPTISTGSVYATTTSSPVNMYVNAAIGKDTNDGLSALTPMLTVQAALAALPPILLHPCVINMAAVLTSSNAPIPYALATSNLVTANIGGDASTRPTKFYALGIISFSIQDEGSLTFNGQGAVIDGTGVSFGDGEVSAFFVSQSRVVFSGITFQGFVQGAVSGSNSNIEFDNCVFQNNITAGSFDQGCSIEIHEGNINLLQGAIGMILSGSQMVSSNVNLVCTTNPGPFYSVQFGSSLTLATHEPSQETGVLTSTVVVQASINSSVVCNPDFSSGGSAALTMLSVLSRTTTNPFSGGITTDASSAVALALS